MIKIKASNIYVVTYHYVRPIKNSNFPNLKGLELKKFEKQVEYFIKNFNILSQDDLVSILGEKKIPTKPSVILTFDDGYKDHFKYVFPYLKKKNISGIFYPPCKAIENKIMLDVNKLHFILEKEQDRKKILKQIDLILNKKFGKSIKSIKISKIKLFDRHDDKETELIKKILQFYLPERIRTKIIDDLFKKILNINISDFSKKLYMNIKEMKEMNSNNMNFGSHGDNHYWWGHLSLAEQKKEINNSLSFFKRNNFETKKISVCYPYGSYNKETLKLLKKKKINFALTTNVGSLNKLNIKEKYTIPRYDTNDFL